MATNNQSSGSYFSFDSMLSSKDKSPNSKKSQLSTNNADSSSSLSSSFENTKRLLLNIYATKKYAKWFCIDETKPSDTGNFTIYRVIYRFLPNDLNEKTKELCVWKRFSDFKELYKILSKYHASLHRRQQFPEFVKTSTFFGRFDEKVIEERRECALKLLQFCATQPHLYTHEKFIDFFCGGDIIDHCLTEDQKILEPKLQTPLVPTKPPTTTTTNDASPPQTTTESIINDINIKIASPIESDDEQETGGAAGSDQQQLNKPEDFELIEKSEFLENKKQKIDIEKIHSELANLLKLSESSSNEFDYIKKSMKLIQEAMYNEKMQYYFASFELYKLAVATLVKGIQKEPEQHARVKIIRDNTQQLLVKAEQIFELNSNNKSQNQNEQILAATSDDLKRWTFDLCLYSHEIETNLNALHGSLIELSENFVIEKLIDNNKNRCFLLKNKNESQFYLLKTKSKSSNPDIKSKSIVPKSNQVPFMCKLYKYYESEFSIYLLVDYKKHGKLYNFIKFDNHFHNKSKPPSHQPNNPDLHHQNSENLNQKLKQVSSFTCASMFVNNAHGHIKQPDFIFGSDQLSPPKHVFSFSSNTSSMSSGINEITTTAVNDTNDAKPELIIDKNRVKLILAQIICAVEALHSIGIVCKDLRPDNILLDDDFNICLTFFSKWCLLDNSVDKNAIIEMYTAPEISSLVNYEVSNACDLWSIGVIAYELLTFTRFYEAHSDNNYITKINLPSNFNEIASDMITKLIQTNPTNRITIEQLKLHPFFHNINWSKLIHKLQ